MRENYDPRLYFISLNFIYNSPSDIQYFDFDSDVHFSLYEQVSAVFWFHIFCFPRFVGILQNNLFLPFFSSVHGKLENSNLLRTMESQAKVRSGKYTRNLFTWLKIYPVGMLDQVLILKLYVDMLHFQTFFSNVDFLLYDA